MNTTTNTPTTPDLSFYFAIHRHMRSDLVRFADTVAALTPADRADQDPGPRAWAKGFRFELEEHHFAEDEFFFPEMRSPDPRRGEVLGPARREHKAMDVLLARWPGLISDLADTEPPFEPAKEAALALAPSCAT